MSKRFALRMDGDLQHVQALDRVSFTVARRRDRRADRPVRLRQDHGAARRHGARCASSGRVTVDGREVQGCGHDRGMVFQHAELLPWLSALQNVMFGLEMKGLRGTPCATRR